MQQPDIRPAVLCILRKSDQLLVVEGLDTATKQRFFRPPGGTIEFGEHSRQTVAREMQEELGVELVNLKQFGVIESVFTRDGRPRHDIYFIYNARFSDESFYQRDYIPILDHRDEHAVWRPLTDFYSGTAVLHPVGLLELLLTM